MQFVNRGVFYMTDTFVKHMLENLGNTEEETKFKFQIMNKLPKIQIVKFLWEMRNQKQEKLEEEKQQNEEDFVSFVEKNDSKIEEEDSKEISLKIPSSNNLFLIQYFCSFLKMKLFDDEKTYKNQVENQENTSQSIFIPFEWFSKNFSISFDYFGNDISKFFEENYGSVIDFTFKKPPHYSEEEFK